MAKKNWPERPKSLSERGYRKYMARQKKVTVNGTEFTLQSVSPSWYYETNDECGNTGSGKRKSAEYMDRMFKNCVIAPAEVRNEGMAYFDEKDDLKTPEGLIKAIENFLRENREFWCMVFAGSGITYSELKEMDLREYREAVEARLLWQGEWNPNRKK